MMNERWRTRRSDPSRSRWSQGLGPRGMQTSSTRAGRRAVKPCHRCWRAYVKRQGTAICRHSPEVGAVCGKAARTDGGEQSPSLPRPLPGGPGQRQAPFWTAPHLASQRWPPRRVPGPKGRSSGLRGRVDGLCARSTFDRHPARVRDR